MIGSVPALSFQRFRSWLSRRRIKAVLQNEILECAHACLVMIGNFHGAGWTLDAVRARYEPSARGTSISVLAEMARSSGFTARILRLEPHSIPKLRLPCVLHWDVTHYVVLESVGSGSYAIVDPALGRIRVGEAEFSQRFTGIAIEISPQPSAGPLPIEMKTGSWRLLSRGFISQYQLVAGIVSLAVLIEALALAAPFFIQVATDSVIPSGDTGLLVSVAAAFIAVTVVQALVAVCRARLLAELGRKLMVSWSHSICTGLLNLPYAFFNRRSVGDIHSRFGSIDEIQRVITYRFLEGALDGAMAMITLVVVYLYSPLLAALTLGFTFAYLLIRAVTITSILGARERAIRLHSEQQSLLLETLGGIHSVKANGIEAMQLSRFMERTSDYARESMAAERLSATAEEIGKSILRLHWIVAVGAGAAMVLAGSLTAGMLVAYVTYAGLFSLRSTRLVDLWTDWRFVKLHGSRLSDFLASPGSTSPCPDGQPTDTAINLCGVRYAYSGDAAMVLREINLRIEPGECIAIKGASGVGKSTLVRVVMGLLQPDGGRVTYGDVDVSRIDEAWLRRHVGCVLQDDQVFSGTIAENIAFFATDMDLAQVVESARLAQLHEEVMAMPLRYETRIIDMGSTLSGGQKQRLILARALYKRPRILFLDEASSHLDVNNEHLVNKAISNLRISRLIIAHRAETLAIADRVLELVDGTLVPVSQHPRRTDDQLITV